MKKYTLILLVYISLSAKSQVVNRFRDSTWFAKSVRFDSAIYLIKGASNGKVLTSDAYGRATWQSASGGVSQSALDDSINSVRSIRKVDTLYKNLDSIIYKINGIRYAIKDSSGGLTDSTIFATKNYVNSLNGSNATITSLNDSITSVRNIRKVDTLYRNLDSIIYKINSIRYAIKDSTGGGADSQSLHLAFSDSIELSITRGNSIKFAYAIDSVSLITDSLIVFKGGARKSYVKNTVSFAKNTSKDSIILTLNGIRYAVKDSIGSGGGSSSLSSLTSATATNTINNGAYSQEWQWNSQTNAPMLKLSSTSTGALTGGNGLEINLTGTLVNNVQTTYAAKFINTRTSAASTSGGAYFQGIPAIQTMGDISIGGNTSLRWNNGNFDGSYISSKYNTPQFFFNAIGSFNFRSSSLIGSIFSTVDNRAEVVIGLQSATRSSVTFGGDNGNVNGTQYRSESVTSCIIERNLGKLLFSTNVGLAGGFANFTPTYQICVDGTNNNVAIGKGNTAGDASAKLEVVSTTQGFLPPRMTATQASAIVSPAKSLIVYVTDTNGTFTSAGIWIYTTSWKLILAE